MPRVDNLDVKSFDVDRRQVSFCADLDNHMPAGHARWCQAFSLYQKLVFTQKKYGRIEPSLPSKIMTKPYQLPATMDETFKSLYKNYGGRNDTENTPTLNCCLFLKFINSTSQLHSHQGRLHVCRSHAAGHRSVNRLLRSATVHHRWHGDAQHWRTFQYSFGGR